VNNIKLDLGDIGWDGVEWIALTHERYPIEYGNEISEP
jgi:hypothetical protein